MNKFTLLKFPHTEKEIVRARIEALQWYLDNSDVEYFPEIIEMLIEHLDESYEGVNIDQCKFLLISCLAVYGETLPSEFNTEEDENEKN